MALIQLRHIKCRCMGAYYYILINNNFNQYKLKRCSNKECCKQCRYVMFKTMYLIQRSNPGSATDYHLEKYLILSILKVGIDFILQK